MDIKNESDINALTVKALREQLGKSQRAFWGAVCVSVTSGCHYEAQKSKKIPNTVRRLVFLHHVAGIPTDASLADLKKIAERLAPVAKDKRQRKQAQQLIQDAKQLIEQAESALTTEN